MTKTYKQFIENLENRLNCACGGCKNPHIKWLFEQEMSRARS